MSKRDVCLSFASLGIVWDILEAKCFQLNQLRSWVLIYKWKTKYRMQRIGAQLALQPIHIHMDDMTWHTIYAVCVRSSVWCLEQWFSLPKACWGTFSERFTSVCSFWWVPMSPHWKVLIVLMLYVSISYEQVTEDDTYPKIVCPDCVYKLDTSYEFKMKSHQSQNVLCGKIWR